ncbi:MAG: alpha-amylase family glycosyl hydrolase, partial [Nevskiales bacterium]
NWENPRARASVYDMMRWWLNKGIDGFRMDVINMISKAPGLPDAPVTTADRYQNGERHYIHGPRLMEFLSEMKQQVLSSYDLLTVGETPRVNTRQAIELTDEGTGSLRMVFQFEHMALGGITFDAAGQPALRGYSLADLKQIMNRWQVDLAERGWNSNYLSNHDHPRQVSAFGDGGAYRVQSAKMLGTLIHLLRGTPYVYQGEEIGMTNVAFDSIDETRDISARNMWHEFVDQKGLDPRRTLAVLRARGRDNARTPMQWDASSQAGFTTGTPWIKVNPNYPAINVAQAQADSDSIFRYYQRLIHLRHAHPAIVLGGYQPVLPDQPQVYAFTRALGDERLLVILNLSGDTPVFEWPAGLPHAYAELLIANYEVDAARDRAAIPLRPYEARVYRI